MTKVLVYELNEVPWKVVDFYLQQRPEANLHKLLKGASSLTTHTVDAGELHPWSTWPTMHRGVSNDVHDIRYINQDLSSASATPPIWDALAASGKKVGICGSLQSFPPKAHKNVMFHIPDTFAPGEDTIPLKYSAFQRVNLKLTGENKAVAKSIGLKDAFDGLKLFRSGVSLSTGFKLGAHLVNEKRDAHNKALRAIMQSHVAFDVFMDALKDSKPDYAAVFSNHVAGTMHRYWKYAFPEDFGYTLKSTGFDQFHSQSILKAMDIFDSQLGVIETFAERHGYDVVVCSSMGQEAVERGEYIPELKLDNEVMLANVIGFTGAFQMKLAMQPDVAFEFGSVDELNRFKEALHRLTDSGGKQVLVQRYDEKGSTLNLSTVRSLEAAKDRSLVVDGRRYKLEELGFSLIQRDPGTGYHQPKGILIWKGQSQPAVSDRQVFDSRQYAPTILRSLGVTPPDYMMESIG